MSKSKTSYPEIDDIREDLDSLKTNVVELTKHVQEDSSARAEAVKKAALSRWTKLKASGQRELKDIERRVKAKPAQSLAIAFGAGLLASMILRGRG